MVKTIKKLKYCQNYDIRPIAFYLKKIELNFYMDMHKHEFIEFMYAMDSTFVIEFSNNDGTSEFVNVEKNSIIFIDMDREHRLVTKPEETPLIGNLEFAIINKNNSNAISPIDINYQYLLSKTYLKNMLNNEKGYMVIKDNSRIKTTMIEFIEILTDAIKLTDNVEIPIKQVQFFDEINKSLKPLKDGTYSFTRTISNFINNNFDKKLKISDLSKLTKKSSSYISHKFKEDLGMSILQYINSIRVKHASTLLKNTSRKIQDIAVMVGFKDKNQLNYEFNKINKMTPREYRNSITYKSVDQRLISETKLSKEINKYVS